MSLSTGDTFSPSRFVVIRNFVVLSHFSLSCSDFLIQTLYLIFFVKSRNIQVPQPPAAAAAAEFNPFMEASGMPPQVPPPPVPFPPTMTKQQSVTSPPDFGANPFATSESGDASVEQPGFNPFATADAASEEKGRGDNVF